MVRAITKDTTFTTEDGTKYNLREGDRVAMYPPAIHKDPEIFEEPMVRIIFIIWTLIYILHTAFRLCSHNAALFTIETIYKRL